MIDDACTHVSQHPRPLRPLPEEDRAATPLPELPPRRPPRKRAMRRIRGDPEGLLPVRGLPTTAADRVGYPEKLTWARFRM